MSYRALMVMRMAPGHADAVAELFAEHDKGDMPYVVGISRRTLFRTGPLHAPARGQTDVFDKLLAARARADFQEVNRRLSAYLQRYAPDSMTELQDSMATPFYTWSPEQGASRDADPPRHQRHDAGIQEDEPAAYRGRAGVFDALAAGPATASGLAPKLGIHPRGARILLERSPRSASPTGPASTSRSPRRPPTTWSAPVRTTWAEWSR